MLITRAQAHAMLDAWWNPKCIDELVWRHRALDRLFDTLERDEEIHQTHGSLPDKKENITNG